MQLNIKALTFTFAIVCGGAVFFAGLANVLWPTYGVAFLDMVASVYPGFHVGGFGEVIIATLYALLDGAVCGLIVGWLYNLFAAPVRTRV
jgi:hypothetical protein